MKSLIYVLFATTSIALLGAETPAWVTRSGVVPELFPSTQFLTGFGVAGPCKTEAECRQQAMAMAREELASTLRVQVRAEFTSRKTLANGVGQSYVNNLVQTRSELELEGLDRFEIHQDSRKGLTYALAIMEKVRASELLEQKLKGLAQDAREGFARTKTTHDLEQLLRVRSMVKRIHEGLSIHRVLRPGLDLKLEVPALADLDAEAQQLLGNRKGLDGALDGGLFTLGANLPSGLRLMIDRIVYGNTRFSSTFGAYLEQRFSDRLGKFDGIRILDKALQSASPLKAQGLLHGSYLDLGTEISLQLKATSLEGEELASVQVRIPKGEIQKANLRLLPENYEDAAKTLEILDTHVKQTALKVRLSLDRGDGAIYRKGEAMHFFLKANLDCYVRVVYHQVDGTQIQIFPNRYHPDSAIPKDRVVQIPADQDRFELKISEPFGTEIVKVFASTVPFKFLASEPVGSGFAKMEESVQSMNTHFRGITIQQAEALTAEDTVVINTVSVPAQSK